MIESEQSYLRSTLCVCTCTTNSFLTSDLPSEVCWKEYWQRGTILCVRATPQGFSKSDKLNSLFSCWSTVRLLTVSDRSADLQISFFAAIVLRWLRLMSFQGLRVRFHKSGEMHLRVIFLRGLCVFFFTEMEMSRLRSSDFDPVKNCSSVLPDFSGVATGMVILVLTF